MRVLRTIGVVAVAAVRVVARADLLRGGGAAVAAAHRLHADLETVDNAANAEEEEEEQAAARVEQQHLCGNRKRGGRAGGGECEGWT